MRSAFRFLAVAAAVLPACALRTARPVSRRNLLGGIAALGALSTLPAPAAPASAAAAPTAAAAGAASPASASGASDFLSGLLAGGVSRTAKLFVLHPIDTVKTRVQVTPGKYPSRAALLKDLYDGILPPLVAGTPGSALFFGVKDYVQGAARASEAMAAVDPRVVTAAAVAVANVPYWLLQTPAEAVKTRLQARGRDASGGDAGAQAAAVEAPPTLSDRARDLYAGYTSNLAYAFPVDVIKFLVYDEIKRRAKERNGGRALSPLTAALCGSAASSFAQAVTTPLDVVRTRVMLAGSDAKTSDVLASMREMVDDEGAGVLMAGLPQRVARGMLGGAVQFSTYEIAKNLFGEEVAKKMKK